MNASFGSRMETRDGLWLLQKSDARSNGADDDAIAMTRGNGVIQERRSQESESSSMMVHARM